MTTRTAGRLAILMAGLYVVMESAGLAFQFVTGVPENPLVGLPGKVAGGFVFLAWVAIGGMIAARRPRNAVGWIIAGIALVWAIEDLAFGYGVYALVTHPGSIPGGFLAALTYNAIFFIAMLLIVLLFLLFPEGRALSRRWLLVGWTAAIASLVVFVGTYLDEGPIEPVDVFGMSNPYWTVPAGGINDALSVALLFLLLGMLCASVVALFLRLRRARGDLRQQMRWFAYAAAFLLLSFALIFFGPNRTTDVIGTVLLGVAIAGIPVAAAIAIFKYRLYDIDIVINKTIAYGVLAAFFTAVYLAVVVGVGTAIGSGHNPILTLLAAAVIALAFNPVRDRAKKLANRIAYGKRASPYEVLSEFADRMAATHSLEDVLPRTAQVLAQGTGATRADVWLLVGSELLDEGPWPDVQRLEKVPLIDASSIEIPGASRAVPVRHQGELLGAISIHKAPGDPVSHVEDKLLSDVASQAGLVLRNVHLIEDLKASRQRLVKAQDAAARRLERNIHDGAQQQLVALAVKQRLAASVVGRDDERARAILEELQTETNQALEDLRDLARGVYPPLLADQGLTAALEAQARKSAVPVDVVANGVGRFPQEIEAAVYFSCLEALQNVAKYAGASRAVLRLANAGGEFTFEVADDGVGFDSPSTGYGTGLQGMADRLDALGGRIEVRSARGEGTTVAGRVPLPSA